MDNKQLIIECKRVKFYTSYDEDAFFEYLQKIKNVIDVKGKKDSLFLTLNEITDEDIYNLVGLLRRYKIKMDALASVLPDSQLELFHASQKGHHINVYPAQ